jgi:hypothetical protein
MGFEDNPYPIHIFEVGGAFFYTLALLLFLLLFLFLFFFFPQLPTLFPPGKGPFASLAWVLTSTTFICH